jgi:FkbM family methyltransferase
LAGCIGNAVPVIIQTADLIAIGFVTRLIRMREEKSMGYSAFAGRPNWLQGVLDKWKKGMSGSALTGSASHKKSLFTKVPGARPIELVAYYPEFVDYYPECELQTKRWFVENMGRDWVSFDVGANIGYYSILFSRLSPEGRVYAFEPTDTIELLRKNLAHHSAFNVEPMKIALGSVSGRHTENVFRIWGQPAERKEYDFETIDSIATRLRIERLDCLKIDVDSFDFEVLRGAQRTLERFNPWIIVELNHALAKRNQTVNEALEWLVGRGYEGAFVTDYENFILRRRETTSAATCSGAMRLTFDSRPMFLLSEYAKGEPLAGVVAPECEKLNDARIEFQQKNGPWRLIAPGPRWSFAASWVLSAGKELKRAFLIEIELRVSGGTVGIGCVTRDYSAYKGKEALVEPAPTVQKATVVVDDFSDLGYLILRNTDVAGSAAQIEVVKIGAFIAEPAAPQKETAVLSLQKTRLSIAECDGILHGGDAELFSGPALEPGISVVPVEKIQTAFGFRRPFVPKIKIYRHQLADFKTEIDEAAIYSYIYEQAQPKRHLEFGTWEGFGATLCANSCEAEIWTVNLPDGEKDQRGEPVYDRMQPIPDETLSEGAAVATESKQPTDAGRFIGWRYRAAGFADRVHQILCDSRDFDTAAFGQGFFDSVLIDGGHTADVVTSDTNKALPLLRSGGIMIWHDFCPDPETIRRNESPRGVVSAIVNNFNEWNQNFSKIFWIQPSWILVGIRA